MSVHRWFDSTVINSLMIPAQFKSGFSCAERLRSCVIHSHIWKPCSSEQTLQEWNNTSLGDWPWLDASVIIHVWKMEKNKNSNPFRFHFQVIFFWIMCFECGWVGFQQGADKWGQRQVSPLCKSFMRVLIFSTYNSFDKYSYNTWP